MNRAIIYLIFCYLSINLLVAQTIQAEQDSLQQDRALVMLQRADSAHTRDSLQKELLRRQLGELSKTETTKRKKLELQLASLTQHDSLMRIAMKREVDSLKSITKGYAIVPYNDTIFIIVTKIGKITAKERAEIITERLKRMYKAYLTKFDSLSVVDYGQSVDIVYKDQTLMSVTEYDALWYNKSKLEIAQSYKNQILTDLLQYKQSTSLFTNAKHIALAIIVILLQILLIRLVNHFFRKRIDNYIVTQKGGRLKGLKIKDFQFLDESRQTELVLFVSKIVRWFLNIIQLYITIPILFSIFPPTQRLAETLFGYILVPAKRIGWAFVNYLPNLFAIIVIVVITRYVIKFLQFLTEEIALERLVIQGFYADWARPTFNIVRFLVYAFMFVVMFPYLPGSDSPVFQGVSVFLGIVFSLGSSSVISNMVAGLVMTYMRPFQLGDRIKVADIVGDVVEKTPFVTRIKTTKNEFITIPNSNILSSNVLNFNTSRKTDGIILHTTVTIGYDVPWRQVHQILIDAALRTNLILHEPSPFVLQTSLDDFYVAYQLNAYSIEPNKQAPIYSELHQNIQDCFNESGVEILSPHYRAQRDGNATTTPSDYLATDYVVPSFRVERTDFRND